MNGSHLAWNGRPRVRRGGKPSFAALRAAVRSLRFKHPDRDIHVAVDATLRHDASAEERPQVEAAIAEGKVVQPSGPEVRTVTVGGSKAAGGAGGAMPGARPQGDCAHWPHRSVARQPRSSVGPSPVRARYPASWAEPTSAQRRSWPAATHIETDAEAQLKLAESLLQLLESAGEQTAVQTCWAPDTARTGRH